MTLKDYFSGIAGEHDRHMELGYFLGNACDRFQQLAHKAGIEIQFHQNIIDEKQPKLSIEIEKGWWPRRTFANIQVRERSEGEGSNYKYSVRFQTGSKKPGSATGHHVQIAPRSRQPGGASDIEQLIFAIEKFICENLLNSKEFTRLQNLNSVPRQNGNRENYGFNG